MTSADDETLARARGGDEKALESLLAIWEPRIYRFGLRMCGDADAAREVLQETLIAAFRGMSGFRGESEISTWLYALARSFCLRQRRQLQPESLSTSQAHARKDPDELPDAATHARELGRVLQAALLSLGDAQREVVVLKDVEGLSAEAIARVLHEDVGAVKSRLHRARLALRERLRAVLEADASAPGCPELSEQLAAFAGGELDQSTCRVIEAHLSTCARCRGACDALKHTVSLCQQLPGGEVPAPVKAALRRLLATVPT